MAELIKKDTKIKMVMASTLRKACCEISQRAEMVNKSINQKTIKTERTNFLSEEQTDKC